MSSEEFEETAVNTVYHLLLLIIMDTVVIKITYLSLEKLKLCMYTETVSLDVSK